MQRDNAQATAANKVTAIGAAVDAILGLLKIVFGTLSHSAALIADGIHSLSDLFTDLLVIIILKISGKGPDQEHPWGHGHFETVGTAILGSILIAVAGAMVYDSTLNLINNQTLQIPEWPALAVALLSIILKEWIYRYTLKIGQQIGSDLLIANAWHSRTDALSSIVVFIGVAGAMSGISWLDSAAAIAVAIMVAKIGWDLSWNSFQELVGTALPEDKLQLYKAQIMAVDGVISVHSFKSRAMGNKSLLEMHIQVAPYISASEGHLIGDTACAKLYASDDVGHIIYHIDTYDDEAIEAKPQHYLLPLRNEIEPLIKGYLHRLSRDVEIDRLYIHYQNNQVELDILLSNHSKQVLERLNLNAESLTSEITTILTEGPLKHSRLGKILLAYGAE